MKLIDRHWEWMKAGELDDCGLCAELFDTKYIKTLELFDPTEQEYEKLEKDDESEIYWGSGLKFHSITRHIEYTPRRQSIVLLICAMHNEI